uniref:RBR-type E3 ubiquitin transferase n=1 Tax=Panagrolaimus sp. JU765 TaxID=591449 RepID=A0AC34R3X0_9BILA
MDQDFDAGFSGEEYDTDEDCASEDDGIEVAQADAADAESSPSSDCQVLAPEQLSTELNKIAAETSAIVGLSPQLCRIALHHLRWSKEILLEKYYENESPQQFFKKFDRDFPLDLNYVVQALPPRSGTCLICYDQKMLTGLSCGHLYCLACWHSYLSTRFHEYPDPFVLCPEPKCKQVVGDEIAMKLLTNEADKRFYQRVLINSFVECNKLLKWCPAPNCDKVIKVSHPECRAVTCDCECTFCFKCSNEWHEPIDCELLSKWIKKCSDDSETSNWLNANTKDCPKCHVTIEKDGGCNHMTYCPKCHVTIEKDGGCNHMTCRSQTCRFEFCWTCLGPWQPHGSGWYACNRFDDKAAKDARSQQENSRAALQRYLHYYNRFANHQNSLKFENRLMEQIKIKVDQMQAQSFSWIETQFLIKSVQVLNKCRRTLMYTYAFAFYLQPNNITSIFEDNQRDLELATEQLSEVLEREINPESDDLVVLKQKVQDKCHYVDTRRQVLLKHCQEGLERNQWIFRTAG